MSHSQTQVTIDTYLNLPLDSHDSFNLNRICINQSNRG